MKTVLVTGSHGFAGRHTCKLLVDEGYNVIGLARTTGENGINNWATETADIKDADSVYQILDEYRPEFIIHLAAKTKGWFTDQKELFQTNLDGTINLYDQVIKLNGGDAYEPKILYVSSSEIYGNTNNPRSIDENAALRPANLYSASKASADLVSHSYAVSKRLNIVVARPFTHTGPYQTGGFFVSDMIAQLVEIERSESRKGTIKVGNLSSTRDYSDVRDIVRAYIAILETDSKPGEVFNVCSGKGVVVGDILNMLINLSTADVNIEVDQSRYRPIDTPIFVGDASKLTEATGWTNQYPLEETLRDSLEYYRGIRST